MDLTFEKSIVDGKFLTVVSTSDFAQSDLDLMSLFGEPVITIGGELENESDEFLFNYPKSTKKLLSEFPVTVEVSREIVTDASISLLEVANSLNAKIQAVITTALTTLRTNADTFSGTTEVTI